jgi:uncharacterized protein YacL
VVVWVNFQFWIFFLILIATCDMNYFFKKQLFFKAYFFSRFIIIIIIIILSKIGFSLEIRGPEQIAPIIEHHEYNKEAINAKK